MHNAHHANILQENSIQALIMAMMGMNRYAYIKESDDESFTVFAADGTALAEFDNFNEAHESILRHHLTPVQLH